MVERQCQRVPHEWRLDLSRRIWYSMVQVLAVLKEIESEILSVIEAAESELESELESVPDCYNVWHLVRDDPCLQVQANSCIDIP